MHIAGTALLALLLAAPLAAQELAPVTPELGSYHAHVAAAANALELDRASEARRWLAAAHGGKLGSVVFAPDGERLLSVGADRVARLWSVPGLEKLAERQVEARNLTRVAWSPDGRRLATVSEDFTARLWDTATWAQVLRLGFSPHQTYKARWSGDGHTLAVVPMDGTVRLLDGAPGR